MFNCLITAQQNDVFNQQRYYSNKNYYNISAYVKLARLHIKIVILLCVHYRETSKLKKIATYKVIIGSDFLSYSLNVILILLIQILKAQNFVIKI